MSQITGLDKKDFKELSNFLNKCFYKAETDNFITNWYHIYADPEKYKENNFVMKKDKKIIGHIGVFPMEFTTMGDTLVAGGIGGVATDEACRGQGIMTQLLNFAIEIMQKRKYDISVLGGDRQRYGHFGWESAGKETVFIINKRSLSESTVIKSKIRKINSSDEKAIKKIIQMHEREPLRVKRTEQDCINQVKRTGVDFYVSEENENLLAYGVYWRKKIAECGGKLENILDIIKYMFIEHKLKTLEAPMPALHNSTTELFYKYCNSYSRKVLYNIKILNLRSTIKKFIAQMETKRRRLKSKIKGTVTFEMLDSKQLVTINVGNKITISDRPSKNKISLTDNEMAELIFGPFSYSEIFKFNKNSEILDLLFPVLIYRWYIDGI